MNWGRMGREQDMVTLNTGAMNETGHRVPTATALRIERDSWENAPLKSWWVCYSFHRNLELFV